MASLRTRCCSLALTALLTAPTVTFAEEPLAPEQVPARIVPAFEDGQLRGFKLFNIQKGSKLAALGLADGDVVQQADGKHLRAPSEMAALLARVEAGARPSLTVLREGVHHALP
jgi:type II secretory pathway component PulC